MPLTIVRDDITRIAADAIVNTANPKPMYANGVDHAIYEAAGAEKLLAERKKIGEILPGNIAVTPAFDLSAKYIFHVVGPWWEDGEHGELEVLHSCYCKSLEKAKALSCESIAFPLIATGTYGFPKDKALRIALDEIHTFLLENEMKIFLVVFDPDSVLLTGKIYDRIKSSINDQYARALAEQEYVSNDKNLYMEISEDKFIELYNRRYKPGFQGIAPPIELIRAATDKKTLKQKVGNAIEMSSLSFAEMVLKYIDESGENPSDIYNRAAIARGIYSKMQIEGEKYHPKKEIALKWCLGLGLNVSQSEDLLARAGYSFSLGDKEDIIIMTCIENKVNRPAEIDLLLYEYGCKPVFKTIEM